MINANTFHVDWTNDDNCADALFWVHWLMEPGRFYLPEDKPPRESWQLEQKHKIFPTRDRITAALTQLNQRVPASYEALATVMVALRVRDALPPTATDEQKHAAEAIAIAADYAALYAYGGQLHERP